MIPLTLASSEVSWFVAVASGLAALYTFLTPIVARRQGRQAEVSQDRRVDFDKMLGAMDKEDERKSKEIIRLETALIAERKRSGDLEDELYKANAAKSELEGLVWRAGWRKTDKGWQPNGAK